MDAILRLTADAYSTFEVIIEPEPGAGLQVAFYDASFRLRVGQLNDVQTELQTALKSGTFIWADVQSGAEWSACEALLEALGIAPLEEGAERMEEAVDYIAGVLKELAIDGSSNVLHFCYFPTALLTLHRSYSTTIAGALHAGRAIGGRWQSDTVLALLLASSLAPVPTPVNSALGEAAALEALVLALSERDEGDLLLRLSTAQSRVARLKAFCVSKRGMIDELSDAKKRLGPAMHSFLRHLRVRHEFHTNALAIAANRLADHGSTYLGKVQLDVAQGNDQANGVVRVLTVVSTITLPLLFGQGLFSMNLNLPGREVEENINWWLGILAVCSFAVIVGIIALRYIKWL